MKKLILLTVAALFSMNTMALSCHGTEPFWGAKISETEIVVDLIEGEPKVFPVSDVIEAAGFASGFVTTYSNQKVPVAVTSSNECNNGMSDHIFPKEVIIFLGDSVLYGCCGEGVITE